MKYQIAALLLIQAFSCIDCQSYFAEQAWKNAAIYLQQAMNAKSLPCEDFYEHVCGNYGKSNDTMFETSILGKQSLIGAVLGNAIKKIDPNREKTPRYQKALKNFYDKCTTVNLSGNWRNQLHNAVSKRIGASSLFGQGGVPESNASTAQAPQPPSVDSWYLLGRSQRELGAKVLVEAKLAYVEVNCEKKPELQISPVVPSDFEIAMVRNFSDIRAKLASLTQVFAADQLQVDSVMTPWLQNLSGLYNEWSNASSIVGEGVRVSLANLSVVLPGFNWRSYLRGLLPQNVSQHMLSDLRREVYVTNLEAMQAISAILEKYSADYIKSFVFLKAFYSTQEELVGDDAGVAKLLGVAGAPNTPHERCLGYALRHYAPALARLYFDTIGIDILQWRHEVQMLARNIFSAFRYLLNNVNWLDAEDKEKIQEKIDHIIFYPGVPKWIKNEARIMRGLSLYDTSSDPFENEFSTGQQQFDNTAYSIMSRTKHQRPEEPEPNFSINAEYLPSANSITMFLGLMLPPLFNLSYPLPVKYGGLGFIISHELMHAFDARGIYQAVDADHEWLKPSAFQEFERKKACMVRQYSKYCFKDIGECVKGERTIKENIADIAGIKVAYTAYKIVSQVIGTDPQIPGLGHYTHDQLFFMSFARTWCSKSRPPTWGELADPHTPDRPRVDVTLRNVPLFSRAFNCTMGTRYALKSRGCSLWGDLVDPVRR